MLIVEDSLSDSFFTAWLWYQVFVPPQQEAHCGVYCGYLEAGHAVDERKDSFKTSTMSRKMVKHSAERRGTKNLTMSHEAEYFLIMITLSNNLHCDDLMPLSQP